MLSFQIDSTGPYQIRWPESDADILELGKTYQARESTLTVDQQVREPSLVTIGQLYSTADTAVSSASQGEIGRATGAENYRLAMEQAMPLLRNCIKALEVKYSSNLANLEKWGIDTKVAGGKVTVYKPRHETKWAELLQTYVAQESSLPEADRITQPGYDQMSRLAIQAGSGLTGRNDGRKQREQGVSTRLSQVTRLLDILQIAAGVLVSRYDCKVTKDLLDWGFTVIERPAASATKNQTGGT